MSYYKEKHMLRDLFEEEWIKEGSVLIVHVDPEASYIIPAAKSGIDEDQVFTQDRKNSGNVAIATCTGVWKRGMIQFILEPKTCKEVKFAGKKGYRNGWKELNSLCDALYSQPQHYVVAHNMTEKEFRSMPRSMRRWKDNEKIWLSTPFCERKIIRTSYCGMKSVQYGRVKDTPLLTTLDRKEELTEKMWIWPVLWIPTNATIVRYFSTGYGESNAYDDRLLYLEK